MTDQTVIDPRIEGNRDKTVGKARAALGRLTGNRRQQVEGHLTEYKGKARDAYGRVIDGLDGLVERAPADYQDKARKGLNFARRKPLLTTGIIAGLAVLLGALGRRR
ncbi:CsbD family protein [Brevundimonas sp. A19_0]|uniref:CsbD family protein n=1 Tax=Brevundimonas sp. A19_0 TaxID=2821087 RepID=UPI001AD96B2C|nr:CsbD family protein [Brevundimonas sp. A19_0]MBO9500883.1 CsbD family protein [Brevundimonas sp. A19_0]